MKVWSLSMSKSKYPVYMHFFFFFSGIDLAFIENGFIYHTKYDTADRILTDSIQRAGTQTSYTCICYLLFIIFYLTRIVNTFNASSLVAASVCQGESGHCSSGLEWLETAVDTISLSQTLTRAVHLCSYPPVPDWSALC